MRIASLAHRTWQPPRFYRESLASLFWRAATTSNRAAMADVPSPSSSPAQTSTFARSRKMVLDSPQNSAKRQRRSASERSQMLAEVQQLEDEVARLTKQRSLERARRGHDDLDGESDGDEEKGDIEALEALLKDMDDGALAALLTHGISPASLDALLPHLAEDKRRILPPAASVGIEGTGSGLQMDAEAAKLEKGSEGVSDEDVELALSDRIARGETLLHSLARFCSISFYKMASTPPREVPGDASKLTRTITMAGELSPGLGEIQLTLQVEEDAAEVRGAGAGPEVVKLDVDLGDEVFRALGEDHLRALVDEMNLPALLLSVRTLLPMAMTRLRLFQSIASTYGDLAQASVRRSPARRQVLEGGDSASMLATLVDPASMETLTLQNKRGARLDITFAIRFNQWGHARPDVTVHPVLPASVRMSDTARQALEQLPAGFSHLCAHLSPPHDVSTALVTTIHAFFGL